MDGRMYGSMSEGGQVEERKNGRMNNARRERRRTQQRLAPGVRGVGRVKRVRRALSDVETVDGLRLGVLAVRQKASALKGNNKCAYTSG